MMDPMTQRQPIHHPEYDAGDEDNPIWWAEDKPGLRLVVFVQGFGAPPGDYDGLLEVIRSASNSDVYAPRYAGEQLLSDADPRVVTTDLAERLNEHVTEY